MNVDFKCDPLIKKDSRPGVIRHLNKAVKRPRGLPLNVDQYIKLSHVLCKSVDMRLS